MIWYALLNFSYSTFVVNEETKLGTKVVHFSINFEFECAFGFIKLETTKMSCEIFDG